jgi:hypothetical protein
MRTREQVESDIEEIMGYMYGSFEESDVDGYENDLVSLRAELDAIKQKENEG